MGTASRSYPHAGIRSWASGCHFWSTPGGTPVWEGLQPPALGLGVRLCILWGLGTPRDPGTFPLSLPLPPWVFWSGPLPCLYLWDPMQGVLGDRGAQVAAVCVAWVAGAAGGISWPLWPPPTRAHSGTRLGVAVVLKGSRGPDCH